MTENSERIILRMDNDLKEIIPTYLESRQQDVIRLSKMLAQENFESLQTLGHRMKGTGAAYGFNTITDIGRDLEIAAKHMDRKTIGTCIAMLASYLKRIEIR